MLLSIPPEIFDYHVAPYLSDKDLKNISKTCKRFKSYRPETCLYTLTKHHSMKFITSCYFRKKVSKIFKSNVALAFPPIHIDNYHIKSPEAFKCIYSINLSSSSIYDVSILRKISVIDLSWTAVEDVSALSHAHTLNLYSTEVKDVSMLGSVHKLNLGYTKVTDVSALGSVHTLNLTYTKVADVSALGSVHTLILRNTEVTDVSALTKVHTLDLHETKVSDISNLINVYDLDLSFTYELRDFKPIANFKKLRILNLTNSRISDCEDISFLSFVYSLNLTYTVYKGLSRNIVHKDPMFIFK